MSVVEVMEADCGPFGMVLMVDMEGISESLRLLGSAQKVVEASSGLLRQHDLAQRLGVSDKRVATWRARAARNGFPDPVACHIGPTTKGGKRRHMLWDLEAVQAWFRDYSEAAQRSRKGPYWKARNQQEAS